jgi:hypothetical protein
VFVARDVPRKHHTALRKHLRSRPAMFNPTVVEAVDAYLSTPDEEFMSSRFDGVTDKLRGFDPRVFN